MPDGKTGAVLRPRGPVLRALGLALLALAFAVLSAAPEARAVVLVSNTGKSTGTVIEALMLNELAAGFTTGSSDRGYVLTSIEFTLSFPVGQTDDFLQSDLTVQLWSATTGGAPNARIATLTNPSSFVPVELNTFTAPADTTLESDTKYFLWVRAGREDSDSFGINIRSARSSGVDARSLPGWSLESAHYTLTPGGSVVWDKHENRRFKITVNGTVNNTAATGAPTISGTALVNRTLTADLSGIQDADGVTNIADSATYQWIRVDGSDEDDITGATSSTYTLVAADQGKKVKVRVAFTDDAGSDEERTSGATATVGADTTAPALESAEVPAAGTTVALTFDEDLKTASADLPATSAFTVEVDGTPVTVSSVSASGKVVTLTLASDSTIEAGATVTVSYADPTSGDDTAAIQDAAGNDAASFTDVAVTNNSVDTTGPALESAEVPAAGTTVALTFDEDLKTASADLPATSAFTVEVDGTPVTVSSVSASGKVVTLTLASDSTIEAGATVTVSYADPTSGDDTAAIQDAAGNDAASFTDVAVTNNSTADITGPMFESAMVSADGTMVALTFDEDLETASADLPGVSAFTVEVDGTPVTVSSVSASGKVVTLTLASDSTIEADATVTVSYADPTSGDDPAAIQDATGNDAASFTDEPVTNLRAANIPATGAPTISGGETLTASTRGIADGNGLDNVKWRYQWIRVDGDEETNIPGARQRTYRPTPDDWGKSVKVRVTFTDDHSYAETRTSAAFVMRVPGFRPTGATVSPDGSTLDLTFSRDLDLDNLPTQFPRYAVTIRADGIKIYARDLTAPDRANPRLLRVSDFAFDLHRYLDGGRHALMPTAIRQGQTVTVSYEDPSSVNDRKAIQDVHGNDMQSFDDQAADNGSTLVSATASATCDSTDTRELWCATLTVGQRYVKGSEPDFNRRRLGYGGLRFQGLTSRRFSIGETIYTVERLWHVKDLGFPFRTDDAISLRLSRTLPQGLYTLVLGDRSVPLPGGRRDYDVRIKGIGWSRGDEVQVRLVGEGRGAPVPEGPSLESAEVAADGLRVILRFDKALADVQGPTAADFTVKVNGSAVRMDGPIYREEDGVTDPRELWIDLDVGGPSHIDPNDTVTVSYQNVAPLGTAIEDVDGIEAAAFTDVPVENGSEAFQEACRSNDLWCATMTVGAGVDITGYQDSPSVGSLTDDEFDYPAGTPYGIQHFAVDPDSELWLILAPSGGTVFDNPGFTTVLDGAPFSMDGAYVSAEGAFQWTSSGLSWSDGDMVVARLVGPAAGTRAPQAPPSHDPLTASLDARPDAHDGESAFRVRVAFSEAIATSYRDLDDGFAVTGGAITSVRRVDKRSDLWELKVTPAGDDDVTLTLEAGQACRVTGAPCTGDGRPLAETLTVTVPGPENDEETTGPPLTATVADAPSEHDGTSPFEVIVAFSEAIRNSYTHVYRAASGTTGGTATSAKRYDQQSDVWRFRVTPAGPGAVTFTLAGGGACAGAKSAVLCTSDGRVLTHDVSTTIRGPARISVADAEGTEGADATLDFTVTLSRPALGPVTVDYATHDGTATAGEDYTATRGTLTFAVQERTKTVSVPLLDDSHDDDGETFTLTLANAVNGYIENGTATGTIKNDDPLQQAWLARFGRTVATHVTDAVGERLRGAPGAASHVTIGGYRLPLNRQARSPGGSEVEDTGQRPLLAGPNARSPGGSGPVLSPELVEGSKEPGEGEQPHAAEGDTVTPVLTEVARVLGLGPGATEADGLPADPRRNPGQTLTLGQRFDLRQVLMGSSFRLNLGADDADSSHPRLTAWGRFAGTRFEGQDGDLTLDGDVFTGTVGIDGEWDRLLAGVAVAHSRGDGSYAMAGQAALGQGDLEQTLTSLHPYVRYAVTDRLDVWGLLGYGWGELEVELATGTTYQTDATQLMGAFGGRGIVLAPAESGGFQLATRTDAMLTRTSAEAVPGLAAADGDAHRVRVILEGSRAVTWQDGRSFTPTMELGLRHDWGDAETGFGVELGGRVQYADPTLGLTIEGAVRGLLAHEDSDYQEWGASGTIRLAPGAGGQGLSVSLAPTWGAAASGVDGLWSRQTAQGLAPQGTRQAQAGRLNADVGYGVPLFDTGLLTPYAGTVLAEGAARTYRVGARWQGGAGLTLNLEGTRQESAGAQPVNQGVRLQATWGF